MPAYSRYAYTGRRTTARRTPGHRGKSRTHIPTHPTRTSRRRPASHRPRPMLSSGRTRASSVRRVRLAPIRRRRTTSVRARPAYTTTRHTAHRRTSTRHGRTTRHHIKRHTSKHLVHENAPFYREGGIKPSTSFKAKVEESLSDPVKFEATSGNVIVGAFVPGSPNVTVDYMPAKYFQPHSIDQVGSPAKDVTAKTQLPYHLFTYKVVTQILVALYGSIGNLAQTMKQVIRVSGHMDYILTNESVDIIKVDVIRWTLIKQPSDKLCSITRSPDPLIFTDPVLEGSPLNLIGAGLVDGAMSSSTPDALNADIMRARLLLKNNEIWNEHMQWKMFTVSMKPGVTKKFRIGKRLLEIDTQYCYDTEGKNNYDVVTTWNHAFIPGATGLLFRVHSPVGLIGSAPTPPLTRSDNDKLAYSIPELLLQTRSFYTAYDWIGNPERQGDFVNYNTGVFSTTGNGNINIINLEGQRVFAATA